MSISGLVSLVKTECSGKFFFAYVCAPKYACSSANSFLSAQAGLSAHGSGARALHTATQRSGSCPSGRSAPQPVRIAGITLHRWMRRIPGRFTAEHVG